MVANTKRISWQLMRGQLQFDEIGYWSEIKLEILKNYAKAYSTILSARENPSFYHIYIDAFAGAGVHVSETTGDFVLGSPLNALRVHPAFWEYHLIDIKHERYQRALCILDPYALHLNWTVIAAAGQSKAIDMFLNFPVADMNRNVLWRDPESVEGSQKARMTAFWGGTWHDAAYQPDLFGNPDKQSNETIAEAFRVRLKEVAGFAKVPKPIPMRNSKGAMVYYLFFASQKDAAEQIVIDIFKKYENRGAL